MCKEYETNKIIQRAASTHNILTVCVLRRELLGAGVPGVPGAVPRPLPPLLHEVGAEQSRVRPRAARLHRRRRALAEGPVRPAEHTHTHKGIRSIIRHVYLEKIRITEWKNIPSAI